MLKCLLVIVCLFAVSCDKELKKELNQEELNLNGHHYLLVGTYWRGKNWVHDPDCSKCLKRTDTTITLACTTKVTTIKSKSGNVYNF